MAEPAPDPWKPPRRPRLSVWERAELRAEDRRRMWENLAAAVAVIALIVAGFWLIERISAYSRNVECLQFKLRQCR